MEFLFIQMDDDKKAHCEFLADEAAVRESVKLAVFSYKPGEAWDDDHVREAEAIAATLLEDGVMHFEGDAPLYLFRVGSIADGVRLPVAQRWPAGLLDRIKAAEQRVQDNRAPRSIPADPNSDVDLVLAEVRYLIEGTWPPFWIKDALGVAPVPAAQPVAYYDPAGDRVVTAAQMHSMLNHQGAPGKTAAKEYTVRLVAAGVREDGNG
jgi:hypothetical protein